MVGSLDTAAMRALPTDSGGRRTLLCTLPTTVAGMPVSETASSGRYAVSRITLAGGIVRRKSYIGVEPR